MRKIRAGYVLIMALLVSAALFFFALMYVQLFRAEQRIAGQGEDTLVAWEAASAGVAMSALQLKASPLWSTGLARVPMPHSGATFTVTFDRAQGLPYSTNNAQSTVAVTGWGGRTVPGGTIHVVSIGQRNAATQVEQALLVPPQSPYSFALFGTNNGSVGPQTVVDAYTSANGPYPSSLDPDGGGNIGTNSVATGKIVLGAGSVVNGGIQVGPGGDTGVIKNNGGTYQSLVVPAVPWSSSPVSPPIKIGTRSINVNGTVTLAPGAYKDISVGNGRTLILNAGTYLFNRVLIQDNATIVVASGPVDFWFAGGLNMGRSSRINSSAPASALNFLGAGTSSGKVTVGSNSIASFTLYAPFSDITVGNESELWGSLLGKTFQTQTGVRVHLDHSLAKQTVAFNILTQW